MFDLKKKKFHIMLTNSFGNLLYKENNLIIMNL